MSNYDHIPHEYRPISMWGYFGYTILFCIPILGLILALVWSLGAGNVNLKDSFCTIKDGELFVRGMHISPYEHGNIFNRDPVRPRRLLMHKREILRLNARVMQDGVALVPLRMYFKDSRVKLELGLCKGKKLHDKRDSEAERQSKRDIERAMKNA